MPPVLAACPTIVTAYTDIPAAVAACTAITLSNIDVPGNSSIVLSKLKPNSHVTFAGRTFFEYSAAAVNALDLITVSGVNLTIDGAPGKKQCGRQPDARD
jgi:polygalacturonase